MVAHRAGLGRIPLGVVPRLHSGSWQCDSNIYCGKWLVNQIQENSLQILHGVYATVFAPVWYRLLGAKVGRDAEISTALGAATPGCPTC